MTLDRYSASRCQLDNGCDFMLIRESSARMLILVDLGGDVAIDDAPDAVIASLWGRFDHELPPIYYLGAEPSPWLELKHSRGVYTSKRGVIPSLESHLNVISMQLAQIIRRRQDAQ